MLSGAASLCHRSDYKLFAAKRAFFFSVIVIFYILCRKVIFFFYIFNVFFSERFAFVQGKSFS